MATRILENSWSEISTQVAELAEREGLEDWAAFRDWAFAEIFRGEALSEAISPIDLATTHTRIDGSDDLEIDGYYENEDDRLISLFQAKHQPRIGRKAIDIFLSSPQRILNADLVNQCNNSEVKYLHGKLISRIVEDSYGLRLVFATSGRLDGRASAVAENFKSQKRIHLPIQGRTFATTIDLQVFDRPTLADLYNMHKAERRTGNPPYVKLRLLRHYEFSGGGVNTLNALIPARDLVDAFRQYEYALFDQNPRLWLGSRTKAYLRMAETMGDRARKSRFHLLNNGLSVLCKRYELVNQEDQDRPVFGFHDFQVVNGCQTTVFLYRNSDKIDDNVLVSLKVTQTEEDEVGQQIAEATNTQTGLQAQQFKSNDYQQRLLKEDFGRLYWFYEIKSGEWQHDTPDKRRYLDETGKYRYLSMKEVAQSGLAFTGRPGEAIEDTRTIFVNKESEQDSQHHYENVFPSDISAAQLLLPSLIRHHVVRSLKGMESSSRDPYNYGEMYIVWLFGNLLRTHYSATNAGYLSVEDSNALRQSIDEWFHDLYEIATDALFETVYNAKRNAESERSTFNQRNFYRSRQDSRNYDQVMNNLTHVLERNRQNPRKGDPFDRLP